jgi:hypothetical protein
MFADSNEVQRRQMLCAYCPLMIETFGIRRCKVCGCPIQSKTRLENEHCPVGKW